MISARTGAETTAVSAAGWTSGVFLFRANCLSRLCSVLANEAGSGEPESAVADAGVLPLMDESTAFIPDCPALGAAAVLIACIGQAFETISIILKPFAQA